MTERGNKDSNNLSLHYFDTEPDKPDNKNLFRKFWLLISKSNLIKLVYFQ